MAGYATIEQVEAGFRDLTQEEEERAGALISEASMIVDAVAEAASLEKKTLVVCRMVRRAIDSGGSPTVPMGASQGTMTAGPYSQSWTIGSGSTGELYLAKLEKRLLGIGDKIGSYSPVEEMVVAEND